jgi:hypothetical protein
MVPLKDWHSFITSTLLIGESMICHAWIAGGVVKAGAINLVMTEDLQNLGFLVTKVVSNKNEQSDSNLKGTNWKRVSPLLGNFRSYFRVTAISEFIWTPGYRNIRVQMW